MGRGKDTQQCPHPKISFIPEHRFPPRPVWPPAGDGKRTFLHPKGGKNSEGPAKKFERQNQAGGKFTLYISQNGRASPFLYDSAPFSGKMACSGSLRVLVEAENLMGTPKHFFTALALLFLAGFFLLGADAPNPKSFTFVREYSYQAKDTDDQDSSRAIALQEVQKLLIEQWVDYLERAKKLRDLQLTREQVMARMAEGVAATIVEENWEGRVYYIKAKMSAVPDELLKSLAGARIDPPPMEKKEGGKGQEPPKGSPAPPEDDLSRWNRAIDQNPQDSEAYYRRGLIFAIQGQHQQAIADFSKAIELNPQHAQAYHQRGLSYIKLERYTQAIRDLQKVVEQEPKNAQAYHSRGFAYLQLFDYGQAIRDFSRALEFDPKDTDAYLNRGQAYGHLGLYSLGIKDFEKILELDPKNAQAYFNRGTAYGRMQNFHQAITDLSRAIELNPQNARAHHHRGFTYLEVGNPQQAVHDFEKSIALDPKFFSAYLHRGNAYLRMGKPAQALPDYDRAIQQEANDPRGYLGRAAAHEAMGNADQAVEDYKMAAQLGNKQAQDYLQQKQIAW